LSVIGLAVALAAGASGCSGETATPPPSSATSTVGSTASSSVYDLGGRDVAAICAQLKVFADRWDAQPDGSTPQQKGEAFRQNVDEMLSAAAKLRTLAPADLADDVQMQAVALQGMVGQFMPSASVTVSVPAGPPQDLKAVGAAQQRINGLSEQSCGFKVWT
jgi:hypothetical protein